MHLTVSETRNLVLFVSSVSQGGSGFLMKINGKGGSRGEP